MTDDEESSTYCPVAFVEQRHLEPIEGENVQPESWRMKERMKTVSVALVMCLNIGVDPPDVVKPQPCARLECWLDPLALSQQKALETIGAALQKLYERWQARARYKLSLDPTVEDVKKLCTSLRRNAKDERVLFHYNGHGVPKPTKNGEIWVFNRSFTQYIPLSIFDLQTWMGAPSIFVWDCNCAAQIVESFKQFSEQHEREFSTATEYHRQHSGSGLNQEARLNSSDTLQSSSAHHLQQAAAASAVDDGDETPNAASATVPNFRDCIQLGACRSDQILPTNPELPADLFTSCLTSPIKVAVLWYILQHNVGDKIPLDIFDKIPGVLTERRTLLGELNWIFTAITDTIAWHVLPRDLFQKLFRQDLLVASLFRNFLLADRVMRSYNCTPVSQPELPPTHEHCMWQAWDFALDVCLSQLLHSTSIVVDLPQQQVVPVPVVLQPAIDATSTEYTHSPFFAIQLTAFEVWLKYGYNRRDPPLQLPIVLQVLLSQVHRIRALELLGRFLDLGSWAVSLALSVGIFPYVLKLLQSSAKELRPLLSFIWAKILAVDSACQQDLIRDSGHRYFLQILSDPSVSDDQKIVSAFVLSAIVEGYTAGQEAVMQGGFISICLDLLTDCKCSMLRRWLTIGLGRLWSDFDAARWQAIRCLAYEKLYDLLTDPIAEVRAAAVYALGTLISNRSEQNDHATSIYHSIAVILVQYICSDGSPLVRKELLVTLHWLLLNFENQFITLTYELLNEEMVRSDVKFDAKQKPTVGDELRPKNGEIATVPVHAFHHRQSSTTIADNLTTSTLLANKDKTESAQNLSLLAPPASAVKLSSVASFSKLIGLGGGSQIKQQPQPTTDEYLDAKLRNLRFSSNSLSASGNIYITVWRTISNFLDDPHPEVVELAQTLVDYINKEAKLLYKAKLEAEQQENGLSNSLTSDGAYSVPVPRQHSSLSATDPNSSDVSRPTFVIGSPDYQIPTAAKTSPPNAQHQQQPSKRTRLLTPKLTDDGPRLSVYSTIYPSPRRQVFVPGPSAKDKNAAEPEKSGRKKALIETNFLPWCCRRFTEPILHLFDESGEKFYNHECTLRQPVCDWAVDTKQAMSELCKTEKSFIKTARLDKQIFVNQNNQSPLCLEFFPLHPYLCVGEKRSFSIWNWEVGHLVSSVENHSADRNTEINFVAVINPLKHGFLFTGTTSGEVRVWNCNLSSYFDYSSSFYSPNKPKLLTAWNCRTNDSCRPWYYVPTCYFWEEDSALLLSGDDTKSVRLWDCHTEVKVQEIFLSSMDGTVKSIMSDTVGHHMIAVGCSDSTVRLFDRRLPTKECHLMTLRDLQSSATKVYLQPKSVGSHLVSGSEDGQICVWDPRMFRDPVASFRVGEGSRMTSMDVHRSTELIACSTTNHKVYTSNFCGQPRGVIQYYDGFMGQRLADVKCLKFHPYRTNLAVGSIDSMLAMYGLS